ncbi:MAG TPA: symmetrical bis(5'-nucleosyl)-tetraphosphatase [Steroidobacteraceae bacterium]|nr:symmetrical bis(5'-nucleosyl)-tetraphosphatase [Steroidobacteraceae bacterium]
MAVYAIGDVQGCCDELERLLQEIGFDASRDQLWFAGDLVNRGPRSLDTLRFVRSLGDSAVTVLGNHDLHLLAVAISPRRKVKSKDTIDDILAAPDRDELLDWLRHRPLLYHDVELGRTMVHAGFVPQWDLATATACARELEIALQDRMSARALFDGMYGDQPDRWSDDLGGVARLRFITNALTRLRFCNADGRLDLKYKGAIDDAPGGLMPWFKVPGRRSRDLRIVCGHWSAIGYHDADGILAIDTGCVWGGQLCAVRLDEPAPPVFVKCSSSGLAIGD